MKFRIIQKYDERSNKIIYMPQKKVLWFWSDMGKEYEFLYSTLDEVRSYIRFYVDVCAKKKRKPSVVEEIDYV